jgi:hypothetical protein
MHLQRFNPSEFAKKLSICTISILLLFFGFFSNSWHVATQQSFLNDKIDNQSLIVGRMVKSRQNGIFSDGALIGAGISNNLSEDWISPQQVHDQYSSYFNGFTFDEYSPYMSQNGGQGMLFSLLDSLIPLPPQTKLKSFNMLTSLLSAIALALVILWFYCEFGLSVAIFVVCSLVLSQTLTIFGRNLYWSIWAFYLPMIGVMYWLRYRRTPANLHFMTFGILVFILVFIKCLINGYEYFTTTLIMMIIPFFYYGIMDRLTIRQFLKGTLIAVFGSFLAILLSLMILSFQIASIRGSVLDGFDHIVYSLGKRTHGDVRNFPVKYTDNLGSSTIKVTLMSLKGVFFDANNYINTSNSVVSRLLFRIRYFCLIALFIAMSIYLFYHIDQHTVTKQRQKNIALIFATWISILAPLSWFVIFKAHSAEHMIQNTIVWQMPFTLFGFAVCGLAVKSLLSDLIRLTSRPTRPLFRCTP